MLFYKVDKLVCKIYKKSYCALKVVYYKTIYGKRIEFTSAFKYTFGKSMSFILETHDGKIKIGKNFVCRNNFIIRSREGDVEIGDNVFLNNNVSINSLEKIKIGNDCIVGENVLFYDHDHKYLLKNNFREQDFKIDEIVIGNNVWIGSNSIILRGSKVGNNVVIGAGVIVKGVIPDNSVVYSKREYITKEIS